MLRSRKLSLSKMYVEQTLPKDAWNHANSADTLCTFEITIHTVNVKTVLFWISRPGVEPALEYISKTPTVL